MEKNSRTEILPGKRDFYRCCKARRSASSKQRVLAAISKLRSSFFMGYKKKICTYYIYIIILEKWFLLWGERAHS